MIWLIIQPLNDLRDQIIFFDNEEDKMVEHNQQHKHELFYIGRKFVKTHIQ